MSINSEALDLTGLAIRIDASALEIAGTAVTATAAELNAIAGNGLSAAELAVLDGVTAGTATASKAVVLNASKGISTITSATITTLTGTEVDLGANGASGTAGLVVLRDGANPGYSATVKTDSQTADITLHTPDPGAIVDAYFALSTAALTAAEVDVLDGVTPGASSPSKALVTDSAESLLWTTTDATASETVTLDVEDTRTGIGATGWAIKGGLNTNVALGSYANGVYGILNFTGSGGAVTGLGAGIAAEIVMGAGTGAGTYAALELELGMPTGAVSANSGTSFIYAQVYGADKTTFDTSGYLMNIQGLTAGTSKCLMNVGTTTALVDFVKGLRIKVGTDDYVIPLITAAEFAS